ncbi:MAG TPA: ribonuclease R [Nitrospiria bacterium]
MPSTQDILKRIEKQTSRPARLKELMRSLGVPKKEAGAFRELMDRLIQEGTVIEIKGNRFGIPNRMNLLTGKLSCHPDGFGFVLPEKEGEADVFIGRRNLVEAMHGDRVVVRIERVKTGDRREGRIIRILEHGLTELVGRYETGKDIGFVIPTDKRIGRDLLIPGGARSEAKDGDLVLARITAYPTPYRNPEAEIIRIIGEAYNPKNDTEMVIAEFGLSRDFPAEVMSQAAEIPEKVPADAAKGRRDLRNLKTVTIDGESARDFDDAVSVERRPDGSIRLWVHIADVGHYVTWDSPLDLEARKRGTSVYFPDAVIPMFPEKISNGICSLNPKVDRLAVTIEMLFDQNGGRISAAAYDSIIQSNERMTYTGVKKILEDRDPRECRRYENLLEEFQVMEELARRLMARRREEGSIDFELPETEIILDAEGRPTDIIPEGRFISHRMIEEFMLAANRSVAEHLIELDIPLIFRIHETPDPEVISDFFDFVRAFDLVPGKGKIDPASRTIHPRVFQSVLEQARGHEEERLINQVLLRSMKKARYTAKNAGHFGLAFEDYTHFTSPIRRYPDLVVHRILKETFKRKRLSETRRAQLEHLLPDLARTSSEREREAMDAEREVTDLKKIRFLSDREGEEYFGHISGVTPFGFFVELEEVFAEGLVRISSIADDYYTYFEKQHCLMGRHHRRVFRLGGRVHVRIERVDIVRRQADFSLVEEPGTKNEKKKGGASRDKTGEKKPRRGKRKEPLKGKKKRTRRKKRG